MIRSAGAVADVVLPDAPAIPGLRFRRVRDDADWAGQADLVRAVSLADDEDYIPTAENLRIETVNQPSFELERDLLLAEIDGRIVAHAEGNAAMRDGRAVHYIFGRVHPEFRRLGLGRALLHWNERRARALGGTEAALGGPDAVMGSWASDDEPGTVALLESEGYVVRRYGFTMRNASLDGVDVQPLPDGLSIRPVTADQRRAIFDADDEAFHDHFEHRTQTDDDFAAMFDQPDLDTSLWRVAWAGDEVAGSVQAWIWQEENEVLGVRRGWLERISVRRPWRRIGLARALISSTLVGLREQGVTEAMLGVDAENPNGALALYESLGFTTKQRAMLFRKPLVDDAR